jgi:hypothetical protein
MERRRAMTSEVGSRIAMREKGPSNGVGLRQMALTAALAVFLLSGARPARAITPGTLGICAGLIAVGLEGLGQVYMQTETWYQWRKSATLSATQKKEVEKAIAHLKKSGFAKEAAQAQQLLDQGLLVFRATKDRTLGQAHGGIVQGVAGNGFITLHPQFFNATNDLALTDITPEQRTRLQALTLIHEMTHLNEQVNRLGLALSRYTRDNEYDPFAAQTRAMPALGYTREEIQTIRDGIQNSKGGLRGYKPYVPLYDAVLERMAAEAASAAERPRLPHPDGAADKRPTSSSQPMKDFK